MEVAINQLECHFQKSVNDIDYVERKLRAEFSRHTPADVGDEVNVVRIMERISSARQQVEDLMTDINLISDHKQALALYTQQFMPTTLQPMQQACVRAGLEMSEGEVRALDGVGVKSLIDSPDIASSIKEASMSSSISSAASCPGTSDDVTTANNSNNNNNNNNTQRGRQCVAGKGRQNGNASQPHPYRTATSPCGGEVDCEHRPGAYADDNHEADDTAGGFVEISMKDFKKVPANLRKGVTLDEMNDTWAVLYDHFVTKNSKKGLSKSQVARKGIENASNVLPCLQALDLCRVTPTGSVARPK